MGGTYLSTPIKTKTSQCFENDVLSCGASVMQGWRETQEDAHNCILDFDRNISLFAVYDGHGGCEVARYCSKHLPDFIKQMPEYQIKKYSEALTSAFLQFDDTLIEPDVITQLKALMNDPDNSPQCGDKSENVDKDDGEDTVLSGDEDNDPCSKEEGDTVTKAPFKFQRSVAARLLRNSRLVSSPCLRSRRKTVCSDGISSTNDANESADDEGPCSSGAVMTKSSSEQGDHGVSTTAISVSDEMEVGEKTDKNPSDVVNSDVTDKSMINGSHSDKEIDDSKLEEAVVENTSTSKSINGKVVVVDPTIVSPPKVPHVTHKLLPENEADKAYDRFKKKLLSDGGDSEEQSDSEADSFRLENTSNEDNMSDQDKTDDDMAYDNFKKKVVSDEDDSETHSEVHSDSDNDSTFVLSADSPRLVENTSSEDNMSGQDKTDEEYDDSSDDESGDEYGHGMCDDDEDEVNVNCICTEKPGADSGCTAVVALVTGQQIYVANAGDSRCVVSKDGIAIDLSVDHKPEDKKEKTRIKKAGGTVTSDGRVNGGLNLSRAIGDHFYKKNKSLPNKDQMITALPDVVVFDLDPLTEFMVLACDGIWNSMTSQEVVDFVRPKIKEGISLSIICEQLFDHCLAPDTMGDGTGCDNMTCVIVKFLSLTKVTQKRPNVDSENDCKETKKQKTDEQADNDGQKSSYSEQDTVTTTHNDNV